MQGPGSCYSAYCVSNRAILLISTFCAGRGINVLRILQFVRESGFTEKTVEMAVVATDFKVRPYFGDFNAVLALRERYRKNTRISTFSAIRIAKTKGFEISLINVPMLKVNVRGCVSEIPILPTCV